MMNDDAQFFLSESIRYARQLPVNDCLRFLRGMLDNLDGGSAGADLRSIIAQLSASDAQLELIQIGQLRLGMNTIHPVAPHKIPGTETDTAGSEGKLA